MLETIFKKADALADLLPGHERRPEQEEMARAVAAALSDNSNLVVEAETGVGKSLGYLIPAAIWAATTNRRLIVSTYTRALQEQLLEKEIPVAREALRRLGLPLRSALLMGADNYLCVARLERTAARGNFTGSARDIVRDLREWAATATTGMRSRAPMSVPQNLWERVCRDPQICVAPPKNSALSCLWKKDRDAADQAHIVVVNHALLLSAARLPSFDAVVIDEAHNLEDAAVSRFGCEVGAAQLKTLCDDAAEVAKNFPEGGMTAAASAARAAGGEFFDKVARDNNLGDLDKDGGGKLIDTVPNSTPPEFAALESAIAKLVAAHVDHPQVAELQSLYSRMLAFGHDLALIMSPGPATARWVARGEAGPELRAAPLNVGDRLSETLFGRGVSVILTSATLRAGRDLKSFKERVGIGESAELVLNSPFDFKTQAGFWCPEDLPDPKDEDAHTKAVVQKCAEILPVVPGGAFILFASWRQLRLAAAALREKLPGRKIWMQGAHGNEELLEHFAAAGDAVLLGVDTFWQGVDVPGSALSCVILAKLPFPSPASPLEQARKQWYADEDRDYFHEYSTPKAVMKFRQGFGRLIRSSTDRGAVICLDPRLVKRGYGKSFLKAIPECQKLTSLDDLKKFFAADRRETPTE